MANLENFQLDKPINSKTLSGFDVLKANPVKQLDNLAQKPKNNDNVLLNDVIHPFVNSAFIEGYDSITHLVNKASESIIHKKVLAKMDLLKTTNNKAYSGAWLLTQASSGLGSLVPFVIAGKLTNIGLAGVGESLGAQGSLATLMTDERVAQIAGAGIYSGMLTPGANQTRFGNALGTMASFGVFEAGNSLSGAGIQGIVNRLGTGVLGGAAQIEVSHYVSVGNWASSKDVIAQSISSGAFNVLLPMASESGSKIIDSIDNNFGRGLKVNRFTLNNDLVGKSPTLDLLVKQNPFARVKVIEGSVNSLDIANKAISLNQPDGSILGHELAHLQAYRSDTIKSGFSEVDSLLNSHYNVQAEKAYIDTRLKGEKLAITAENKIARELGLSQGEKSSQISDLLQKPAIINRTYGDHFSQEFKQFGKIQASVDFHGDGPSNAKDEISNKVLTENYPNGTQTPYGNAIQVDFNPDGSKIYTIADEPSGQILKYVQEAAPNGSLETAYGKASIVTHYPDYKEFQITDGVDGIETGSVVKVFENPINTPYGQANYFENKQNGDIVFKNTSDNSHGVNYKTPQDMGFLSAIRGVKEFNDNSAIYYLNDGSTYESYPDNFRVNTNIGEIQAILRQANNDTYYFPDGNELIAKPSGDNMDLIDTNGNVVKTVPQIEENYPASIIDQSNHEAQLNNREYGQITKIITGSQATNFIDTNGVQHILFRTPQTSDYGNINSIEIFPSGDKSYYTDTKNKITQLVNPVNTLYGYVSRYIEKPNGDLTYLREGGMNLTKRMDGSIVEDYPKGITTGIVTSSKDFTGTKAIQVERYLTALKYHFDDGTTASVDYKNSIAKITDQNGQFSIQTIAWSPLAEDYPDGRPTMWGNAKSMVIKGDGSCIMIFGDFGQAYTNQVTTNLLGEPLQADGGANFRTPITPTQITTNAENDENAEK